MSAQKPKTSEVIAAVVARSTEYARRLSKERRERLAGTLGLERAATPDAIVAAAATRAGTERAFASLPRDARDATLALLLGEDALAEPDAEAYVRSHFGWSKTRARTALEAVVDAGLVLRTLGVPSRIESFPALRIGLGPRLLLWIAGVSGDAPTTIPLVRRLALLLAHAHADPVALTAQSVLAVRWTDRLQEVFRNVSFPAHLIAACANFLRRGGALVTDRSDENRRTWCVAPRVDAFFDASPADLALAFADLTDTTQWGTLLGTLHLLEHARAGGEESATVRRLTELGREWSRRRDQGVHRHPYSDSYFREPSVATAVRCLREIGLADADVADDDLRVRVAAPAPVPRGPFRCTVLPTFEIWVAEDADPVGTADLGRIADLTSVDRVARFSLTQTSVLRAATEPGGVTAAIERLAAAAEHGLPDNVRATLEGWARRATLLRAYRGATVVAATEEQAGFIRGRAGVLAEIAPRVFHVEGVELETLRDAAEKAGYPLAPIVRDAQAGRGEAPATSATLPDVAAQTAMLRRRLEDWAKDWKKPLPTPTPTPRERAPTPPKAPTVTERSDGGQVPDDDDDDPLVGDIYPTLDFRELKHEWPNVHRALRGQEDLKRAVFALTDTTLDRIDLEHVSEEETRTAVVDAIRRRALRDADRRSGRTPSRRIDVPAPVPRPEPRPLPTSHGAVFGPQWETPTAGRLEERLDLATGARQAIEIVYVNTTGQRKEHAILPVAVVRSGRRVWLEATGTDDPSSARYELDRIAAVRAHVAP